MPDAQPETDSATIVTAIAEAHSRASMLFKACIEIEPPTG